MLLTTLALLTAPALPLPQAQLGPRTRGGAGIAATSAPVEISRYTRDAFGYTDPNPPGFHPLGAVKTTVQRAAETVLFVDTPATVTGIRREDRLQGRQTNGSLAFGAGGHRLMAAAPGDLFGTGRSLSVTASTKGSGDTPWLRVYEHSAQGNPTVVLEGPIGVAGVDDIDVACGDLDGDGRDEVAVVTLDGSSLELYLIDDGLQGNWNSGQVLARLVTRFSTGGSPHVAVAQLDADPELEVAFGGPNSSNFRLVVVDDLSVGAPELGSTNLDVGFSSDERPASLTTARIDQSGTEVLITTGSQRARTTRFNAATQSFTQLDDIPYTGLLDHVGPICALDHDGDGIDELVAVTALVQIFGFPPGIDLLSIESFRWTGSIWAPLNDETLFSFPNQGDGAPVDIEVVALDEDRDGLEEFRAVIGLGDAFIGSREIERITELGGTPFDVEYTAGKSLPFSSQDAKRLALVAGDDDGEATVLRWTGIKRQVMSSPIPVLVMEAVPTRFGVGQDLSGSSSSFTTGTSSTETISTSVGVSASFSVGVTSPDLFGAFEVSANATLSSEVSRTTGVSETVRTYVTQTAGPEDHAILFQGTLFTQYDYEVLSAPSGQAVGSTYAINIPVATEEWRWPLRLYNGVFPGRAIEPSVAFAHSGGSTELGDPASYASEADLRALVEGPAAPYGGWVGASANVGQGLSGSTTFGLDLSTVQTTAEELSFGVELASEFKVGGGTFGSSVGLSQSWLYEVQTAADASYSGSIGDLPPSSYLAWDYRAGLVVYSDDTSSIVPFQVMRFWTDPRGSAYP